MRSRKAVEYHLAVKDHIVLKGKKEHRRKSTQELKYTKRTQNGKKNLQSLSFKAFRAPTESI